MKTLTVKRNTGRRDRAAAAVPDAKPGWHADSVRAEQLSAVGQVASRISGELRQPLGVIRNSVYFLNIRLGTSASEKVRRHLSIMLREIDAVMGLVNNLSHLTSTRMPERREADIEVIVAAALDRIVAPDNVVIRSAVDPSARLFCDPSQLRLALTNVITNSVQAMPDGGHILVVCRRRPDELVFSVSDDGPGMTEEVRTRAFEPLFSTSAQRLGLGLTVARRLVGANGGRVEILSKAGKGTRVFFRFPRHDVGPGAGERSEDGT
jgi:signal transduction histidine kinase